MWIPTAGCGAWTDRLQSANADEALAGHLPSDSQLGRTQALDGTGRPSSHLHLYPSSFSIS